ncbi:unnamed protein product [Rotaria sp. Silwood1]|nr:unnamed protein product [Rotaria sp. Silwood1]
MHEFVTTTNNEENCTRIQRTESTSSNDSLPNKFKIRQLLLNATIPIIQSRHIIPIRRQLSHLNKKLKLNPNTTNNQDKNKGYLMVEKFNSDFIVLPNDSIDQDVIQNTQSSIRINETILDCNSIEYPSTISNTNNLLETQHILFDSCITPIHNCLNDTFKDLSIQSNVNIDVPIDDLLNIHDIQTSDTISTQSSLISNDSNHEYTGINRLLLSDSEYIQGQRMDLECLTMFEIDVSNERDSLEEDPDDELEFKRLYDEALKKNLKLKQELKTLKEYHLMNSSWVCEFCTTLNESYIKTSCDVCKICESASPLKRGK